MTRREKKVADCATVTLVSIEYHARLAARNPLRALRGPPCFKGTIHRSTGSASAVPTSRPVVRVGVTSVTSALTTEPRGRLVGIEIRA